MNVGDKLKKLHVSDVHLDVIYFCIYASIIALFLFDLLLSQNIFIFKDWYMPYDTTDYITYIWNDELLGHLNIFRSIDIIILFLSHFLGMVITQKFLFISIFILPYVCSYILFRKGFNLSPLPSFLASIIYSINPITIDFLWGGSGAISVSIIYGIIPVIYYLVVKIYYDYDFLYISLFVMATAFISYNLWQMILLLIPILFHFFIFKYKDLVSFLNVRNISKISIIIPFILVLSLPNIFFTVSRTYMFKDIETASKVIISNLKWGYQYVSIENLLQLKFNASNYFVYKNCFLNGNCNFSYFYLYLFISIILLFIVIGRKKWTREMILTAIFPIGLLLVTLIISIAVKNYSHNEEFMLIFSVVRNPDKILMSVLFFISLLYGILINSFLKKYSNSLYVCLTVGFIFMSMLSVSFLLPIWDGYGGMTEYYYPDKASNLELLGVSNETNLPHILNDLNISNKRVLYLPYCSMGVFTAGDQKKIMPFVPNVLGIRQGGIADGYNEKLVNNILTFYESIARNDLNVVDSYLTLLNVNHIIIKKGINGGDMKAKISGTGKVPYLCGRSNDFLNISRNLNYVTIFENENYIIFEKMSKSLPLIYGLSENKNKYVNFKRANDKSYDDIDINESTFYCDHCIVSTDGSFSDNYRLDTNFNLINNGKENWHSFTIYLARDWNNFTKITFLVEGGIFIGKSENGTYRIQRFENTSPIIKQNNYRVEILKFNNVLDLRYQNKTVIYADSGMRRSNFILFKFDESEGYFYRPNISFIDIKNITYKKMSPVEYSINKKSNITQIIFSENYDSNWIVKIKDKKIHSENSFLGFNNFNLEYDNNTSISLYYETQDIFEKFKLLSMGTLLFLFMIIAMSRL